MSISDAEIRSQRAVVERSFMDSCTIQRRPALGTSDSYNEPQYGPYAVHLAAQPCQFWTDAGSSGGEVRTLPRDYVGFAYRMALPVGTDVVENDTITAVINQLGESRIVNPLNIVSIQHFGTELVLQLEEAR